MKIKEYNKLKAEYDENINRNTITLQIYIILKECIKVVSKIKRGKEEVFFIIKIKIYMKVNGKMIKRKEKE